MRTIKNRNKKEKQLEKFLKFIIKLPHEQYFGIARILNVPFTEAMSKEEIEEEIKALKEELEKIEEKKDVAPDRKDEQDQAEVPDEEATEIEEKDDLAAEQINRVEAMKKRLAYLEEEKDKEEGEIKIQKFRTGEAIMEDTIKNFTELSSTKKKNLLAILKAGAY